MSSMIYSGFEYIGDIPASWKIKRLKNVVEHITTGLNPRDNFDLNSGNNYYVTIKNFKNGELLLDENCALIDDKAMNLIHARSKLDKDDILFASISDEGKAYVIKEKPKNWDINESVFAIRTNDLILPKFLFYVSTNYYFYKPLRINATGSTFVSIKQDALKNAKVVLPPVSEQEKIVNFLDTYVKKIDDMIENLNIQSSKLEEYNNSIISEIVTNGIDNKNFKDTKIPFLDKIPSEWEETRTLKVLDMPITDGPHETPDLYDSGIPFVSAEAVSCGNGKIDFNHIRGYISEEYYKECCKKYIPQKNDIYMIKSGATTGRVSIVDTDDVFTIWSPLAVFRANKEKIDFKFLYYVLISDYYQKQVQTNWSYGTQQNIGMRTLEHLKIALPPLMEQKELVQFLDKKIKKNNYLIKCKQEQISILTRYRQSIIFEYLTGKKRIGVDNDAK